MPALLDISVATNNERAMLGIDSLIMPVTAREILNPYYQKICGMQRRCQMVPINV
jgi:hypothetical protein